MTHENVERDKLFDKSAIESEGQRLKAFAAKMANNTLRE